MSAGRGLHRLGIGISALAVDTAPVPEALRFSLVKTHSVDVVHAPPPGHCPVRARIVAFSGSIVTSTVGFRVDHGNRIFFIYSHVTGLARLGLLVRGLIPSYHMTVKRKRVGPRRLRGVVVKFVGCSCSLLLSAAVMRGKVSVSGTGAVVIGSTRQFKLDSLRRVENEMKHDGGGTFYCLVTPTGTYLAPRSHHHLRTLRAFDSLNDNFGLTVRSLSVHNTNGLLNSRRDKFVRSLNCRACRGVLSRTIARLGGRRFGSLCRRRVSRKGRLANSSFISSYTIRDSLRACFPSACIPNDSRQVLLCHRLSRLRDRRRITRFHGQVVSHFNPIPERTSRLVRIMNLHELNGSLNYRGVVLGRNAVRLRFIDGIGDPFCHDRVFSQMLTCTAARVRSYTLGRGGGGHCLHVHSVGDIRRTGGLLDFVSRVGIGS